MLECLWRLHNITAAHPSPGTWLERLACVTTQGQSGTCFLFLIQPEGQAVRRAPRRVLLLVSRLPSDTAGVVTAACAVHSCIAHAAINKRSKQPALFQLAAGGHCPKGGMFAVP